MISALDTMILIYASQDPDSENAALIKPEDLKLRKRAKILLIDLDAKKSDVMIATVAISEYLCKIPSHKHGDIIVEFEKRFKHLPVFDLRASAKAAELFQLHRELLPEDQLERRLLKLDVMVVASAAVAGAQVFYSHDAKCRKLAKLAGMEPRDLPTHSEDLFVDKKIRDGKDLFE